MASVITAVISLECGAGGGLNGNGTLCGARDALDYSVLAEMEALGEAVFGGSAARAAKRVWESRDPWHRPKASGWSTTDEAGSKDDGRGDDPENKECAPSEWAGTYDYGNR